jgi:sec-independent protein translocase protein TatA
MVSSFAFLDLGTPELLLILAIVLVLFGAKKLPELSKSIGQSARELRKGLNGEEDKKENSREA